MSRRLISRRSPERHSTDTRGSRGKKTESSLMEGQGLGKSPPAKKDVTDAGIGRIEIQLADVERMLDESLRCVSQPVQTSAPTGSAVSLNSHFVLLLSTVSKISFRINSIFEHYVHE